MKMCSSVWFSKGVATRRLFLRRTGISFLARSTQPFVVLGGSCRHDCNIWAMNLLICFLATISGSSAFSAMSSSTPPQIEYPRHIHPGGYSLPPLVEDRLSIITKSSSIDVDSADEIFQTDLLLIKPPDMESLWEWFAYTKHLTDADPSWGRVWPTALSLSRFIIRSLNEKMDVVAIDKVNDEKKEAPPTREQTLMDRISSGANYKADGSTGSKGLSNAKDFGQTVTTNNEEQPLMKRAVHALQITPHIVEVGCGLGVVGLAYAQTISSSTPTTHSCVAMKQTGIINENQPQQQRTITFLDKEPYCLQCVMSSCATNGIVTGSILPQPGEVSTNKDSKLIARAAIDDWTLPINSNANDKNSSQQIKNVCYQDLNLSNDENTILLASDILYEPSTMKSLASKLHQLVHPINGGYCLIADPLKERTIGCRDEFVKSIKALGGEIDIINLPTLDKNDKDVLVEGDIDIDGKMASTVLILVNFKLVN